ncbi:DUF349 domain-containing protein [Pseudoalteromonas sp. MMG010]|uniref:DUF349 domain-containing protein n=1 Tax=Pseudoalteromonas sp. MMG010 TaxID=2822685 RepID=UPI001B39E45C|nr:DUF349 domain-containing protein [Pseudoalteromonas sp. MMG010]MBQ4832208.1 DUF349 domain-containing protein [Pseudoalteromonas sp. MMG010]
MIFKHLFTPKWKHPKQQVRLDSIEKLDKSQDITILQTLALQDSSVEIRRKALQKLNQLPLWWQAYKQDNALKDVAEHHISTAVLNNENDLAGDIKTEYIERFAPVKTLEKLVFVEKEIKARVKLLKRLANPKLIEKAFKEGNESLQLELVDLVISHQLTKSLLKHASEGAKLRLDEHIENQRLAIEMPVQVQNSTRIILAKLNALKEKTDYVLVKQQSDDLIAQWQALELTWLNDEIIAQVDEKYTSIITKVDEHLSQLKQQHDVVQQQLAHQQQQALALANLEAISEEITNALQVGLDAPEQIQQDWLNAKISQAKTALTEVELESNLNSKHVTTKLDKLIKQAEKLPELTLAISEFKAAFLQLQSITPAKQLSDYDAVLSHFNNELKAIHQHLNKIDSALQSAFKKQLNDHKKQFLAAMDELTNTLNKSQAQAKRKARDVKRLIEEGRFNVAFGVFKGFEDVFNSLTENFKQPLLNVKSDLETQLADAKDWQKYAATPKRAELLEEVSTMVNEACTDPKQRAEQVKVFRKRWTELGRLDTEQEKQQGEQFDTIIEQLFAPCRTFFAEQEAQREITISQRKDIIAQLKQLSTAQEPEQPVDWKKYESTYNQLNKQWRSAAKVDPKTYRTLNDDYKGAQQLVTAKLNAYYKANSQLKNELLVKATQVSESDDLAQACQELKQLQQQWQNIGFAGLKAEKALWQKFRQINDATFAKRSSEFEQQKNVKSAHEQQLLSDFSELELVLEQVSEKAQLHDLYVKVQGFMNEKVLTSRVNVLLAAITAKLEILNDKAQQQIVESLFVTLEQSQSVIDEFKTPLVTSLTAEQLVTRIEILANMPSADMSLRMAEQVAMLDDKHRGEQADIEFYLKQFLALSNGSVSADTITKLKTIFLN